MEILIINGSHRTNGNSAMISKILKQKLNESNKTFDEVQLAKENYKYCLGCAACETTGKCIINDGFENVINKLKEAKTIIFLTPCYFDMPTAKMKNFIDRCNPLCDYFKQNKKEYLNIVIGEADINSCKNGSNCLDTFAEIMNIRKKIKETIFIFPIEKSKIEEKLDKISQTI